MPLCFRYTYNYIHVRIRMYPTVYSHSQCHGNNRKTVDYDGKRNPYLLYSYNYVRMYAV